ncbi:MAG TPA: CocE/NonD family hydrolase, partial [Gammaproteobacteria bacterium]|nr:CocE/NonD family hydrolase [Gammaproteobacteria bacterium]
MNKFNILRLISRFGRYRRMALAGSVLLWAFCGPGGPALAQDAASQPQYGVIFEEDVPIRVRDGTVLRADVYRPDAPASARFPVLMSMSAYQKALDRILPHDAPFTHVERPEPDWWTARGYVLV